MAAAVRVFTGFNRVHFEGSADDESPNKMLRFDSSLFYKHVIEGGTLTFKEDSSSGMKIIPAAQEPTDAEKINEAALAVASIHTSNGVYFILIRRAQKMSTFASKIAFPGGFASKPGMQFHEVAREKFVKEVGLFGNFVFEEVPIAVLQSVPRKTDNTMCALIRASWHTDEPLTKEDIRSMISPNEDIDEFFVVTFDEMKAYREEYPPGIQKAFDMLAITEKGELFWQSHLIRYY